MSDFKPFQHIPIQNSILRNGMKIISHSPKDITSIYLDNRETKSHSYSQHAQSHSFMRYNIIPRRKTERSLNDSFGNFSSPSNKSIEDIVSRNNFELMKSDAFEEQFSSIQLLHQQLYSSSNKVEFLIEDGLKICQELDKTIEKYQKGTKRSRSLTNLENRQIVIKDSTTQTEIYNFVSQMPKKANKQDEMDGNRFSFAHQVNQQSQPQRNVEEDSSFNQEQLLIQKLKIFEKKVAVLEERIKIYDSLFKRQDEEMEDLRSEITQLQQLKLQRQQLNEPEVDIKPIDPKVRGVQEIKMLVSKIDMLTKENKYLKEDLNRLSAVSKGQNSARSGQKNDEQKSSSSPACERMRKSLENNSLELRKIQELDESLQIQMELQEQVTNLKLKVHELEMECVRYKNTNNYLHKTLQEQKRD